MVKFSNISFLLNEVGAVVCKEESTSAMGAGTVEIVQCTQFYKVYQCGGMQYEK